MSLQSKHIVSQDGLKQKASLSDALEHGLSEEEFDAISNILKRPPSYTELGIYAVLWSEHCSYKNSVLLLRTLPTRSKYSLAQTGEENAGALDIGGGLAAVFKIESHNHPSAIEPYQGAATGLGGIMRDIFTMGARPLCSANALRFGPPDEKRNAYLLSRAVQGIGDYGNSLGVAVMGGELFFDPVFSRNCLVNAMALGIAKHEDLAFSRAQGIGNPVYLVGASTGRDGVQGASFASQDLSEASKARRSAVQVGDPFLEKLLMEATLELLQTDAVEAIQDLGAGGLSCAAAEMSAKGKVGMELDLDKVPLREEGMSAYEIMLSESQERMLLVARSGSEREVEAVFARWDLHARQIGLICKGNNLRVVRRAILYADVPVNSLALGKGAPRYKREQRRPAYLDASKDLEYKQLLESEPLAELFLKLLASPNLCSRAPLYEQYDSEVSLACLAGPGYNAGVARIPNTKKALAISLDCNSRYVYLDPYLGTAQAVCEGARNVASCGARPIGISNCLNFANPYVPENYYVFAQSIRGMKDACEALQLPVTGGNVSFYNESESGPIFPTPMIAMLGLLDDLGHYVPSLFPAPALRIYLLGDFQPQLGASEYLAVCYHKTLGSPPPLDFKIEKQCLEFLVEAGEQRLLASAYDLSLGGLAFALFRSIYVKAPLRKKTAPLGFRLHREALSRGIMDKKPMRKDVLFFGESNACAVLSAYPEKHSLLADLAEQKGLPLRLIGESSKEALLDFAFFQISLKEAAQRYEETLQAIF